MPDDIIEWIEAVTLPEDDRTRQTVFAFYQYIESHAAIFDGNHAIYFADPDGKLVELTERRSDWAGAKMAAVPVVHGRSRVTERKRLAIIAESGVACL